MSMKFERIGTMSIEEGIALIRSHMRKSKHQQKKRVNVMGQEVALNSLRLYTFASKATCCSNPECSTPAAFFAVEMQCKDGRPVNSHYQLNMYGKGPQGHDVLMTHDHTLARSLGGEDSLANTTTMCKSCNQKKSIFESQEIERLRSVQQGKAKPVPPPPPPTLRTAAFVAQFLLLAQARNMTDEEYRAHCDLMGTTLGPPLTKWPDDEREQAKALGLTRAGLRLHHRHIDEALRPGVDLVVEPSAEVEEFSIDPATLNPMLGRYYRHRKPH